jgi:hypothetical protein
MRKENVMANKTKAFLLMQRLMLLFCCRGVWCRWFGMSRKRERKRDCGGFSVSSSQTGEELLLFFRLLVVVLVMITSA